jgi:hypothetical protein
LLKLAHLLGNWREHWADNKSRVKNDALNQTGLFKRMMQWLQVEK